MATKGVRGATDEAKRMAAAKRAAAALKRAGGEEGVGRNPPELAGIPPGVVTARPAASKEEIAAAVARQLTGGDAPPLKFFTQADTKDPKVKVRSIYFDQPPLTPDEQARIQAAIEAVRGRNAPTDMELMPADVGGLPRDASPGAMGFELGGPNGEGLLDFENPNPTPPQPSGWRPPPGGQAPGVTRVSEYDTTVPVGSAADPDVKRAEAAAQAAAAEERARGSKGDSPILPQEAKPTGPNPYLPSQILNRVAGRPLYKAGAFLGRNTLPAIKETAALATLGGGATLIAALAARNARPIGKWVYDSFAPSAGEAAASPAAPQPAAAPALAPQPQQGQQDNGIPDYIKELQRSRIGQPNSSDIIRSLTRNRGMA